MTATLVTESIWPQLTKLCRSGPAYVAVAYFGKGGPKQLPLRAGSVLVVDASDSALKQGQTWPHGLLALARKGVAIYSAPALHAKVFAFPKAVVVGSTNVSSNSAHHFQEAVVVSRDRTLIKQAREFVLDLATEQLTPSRLRQLKLVYRPPKGGPKGSKKAKASAAERSPLWIVDLVGGTWSESAREAANAGRPVAKKMLEKHEILDEFMWPSGYLSRTEVGDQIVQVFEDGRNVSVYPPATVLGCTPIRQRRGKSAIVFLARPARQRAMRLAIAKKRLGTLGKLLVPRASLRPVRDAAAAHAIRRLWRAT